jgi:hypothetical protein
MDAFRPSMCKPVGIISFCDCMSKNIKVEQRNCLVFKKEKNVYYTIFQK